MRQGVFTNVSTKIDYSTSHQELLKLIEHAKIILKKREFDEGDRSELERLIYLYRGALSLKALKVNLPPHSSVNVPFSSFCLDPSLVAPSETERYFWKKDVPSLPIDFRAILTSVAKSSPAKQELYQELIWNLRNKVRYEDYPEEAKRLLNEIDPQAKFKLPSGVKEIVVDVVENALNQNGVDTTPFEDDWSLIEGKYYRYQDVAAAFEKRALTNLTTDRAMFPVDGLPSIFTESKSDGYSHQSSTFYNSSDSLQGVDLTGYSLSSQRKGIQRIGVYVYGDEYGSFAKLLEDALRDAIIRNSMYWYGGRLSPEELNLVKTYPLELLSVYIQAEKAKLSVLKYFSKDSEDDESDAFRHFMWAGFLTQQLNEQLAKQFLDAHESQGVSSNNAHLRQLSEMDLFNNQKGIDAARVLSESGNLTWKRLEEEGVKSLQEGRLKVLKPNQQIRYPGVGGT